MISIIYHLNNRREKGKMSGKVFKTKMLTLDEMKLIRKRLNISYEEIAKKSGVSISSVQKIFGSGNSDKTKAPNPRHSTIVKLNQAFGMLEQFHGLVLGDDDDESDNYHYNIKTPQYMVSDVKPSYNLYGKGKIVAGGSTPVFTNSGYTYEDYLALDLPEGKQVEIIDGVIYDMAAPSPTHQAILGYLSNYLSNELRKRKRKCLVFFAPFDVRLDFSDGPTTVVQPDIFIKCSQDQRTDEKGEELPWVPRFVIEVVSPSSRNKDMFIKNKKYNESGVVEYWLIDDENKQVLKYNYIKSSTELFTYDDKIKMDIFDGDIVVDMKELKEHLEFYADIIGS